MNLFRKIFSLLMSLTIILSICACGSTSDKDKDTDKDNSSTISSGGGYSSSDKDDYDDTVSDWQQETPNEDEFNNKDESSDVPATTPGSSTQQTVVNTSRPATPEEEEANKPVRGSVLASGLDYSVLTKEENLQYIYKGSNYAYGIDKDNKEYIAFKDEFGDMVDIFNGGGRAAIKNTSSATLMATGKMTDWTEMMLDSWPCIVTHYTLATSGAENEFYEVRYVFKENCISVSVKLRLNSTTPIADSSISRGFLNAPKKTSTRINYSWYYPDSGDQAYQEFESLTFRNQISDDIYAYTYLRIIGQGRQTEFNVEGMNGASLPINVMESDTDEIYGLNVDVTYDISFADTSTDIYQSADYLALFRSWNSDFAAGIALADGMVNDNSTIVEGDEVKLNLNVTNLTEDDLNFSLRYDVRNHYGDIVDAGVFVDNTVYKYADANRAVTVGGKYGIYYLNLYVISEHSTYREMYPFALLPKYEYKYWETAPFGVNSVNCNKNNKEEWVNSGRLQVKIGTANYRIGAAETQYWMADEMAKLGSHRWVCGMNIGATNEQNVASWTKSVLNTTAGLIKNLGEENMECISIGNEFNLQCLAAGGPSEEEVYPIWYKWMFEPSYNAIKEKYPNLRYMPTPDSACSWNWLNQFLDGYINENGEIEGKVWDKVDLIDTHIYGPPYMPDAYSVYGAREDNPGAGLWHIESGMQRMDSNLRRLNPTNPTRTDFMLTEVGYTSAPWGNNVDQRTQADYTARIGAICLGYGADMVQYYCMYDRTSYSTGTCGNGEWHFGLFHEHDYYGVIKPKTSGIAFAIMTRQLESYKKNSGKIDSEYDKGWWNGDVRAFSFDTDLHGKVYMAWSNQEVLPNGKKRANGSVGDRLPTLQWENQWKQTDPTKFNAAGKTVKVVDIMGNATEYTADENGMVEIPLTGSPVYIYGVK